MSESPILRAIFEHPAVAHARSFGFGAAIPLNPFLQAKASLTNDRVLRERLALMSTRGKGLIPNTPAWAEALGTDPVIVVDRHPCHRRLLGDGDVIPGEEDVIEDEPAGGEHA